MARPATSNLRFYMSVATLPDMPSAATAEPMPPDGHKAHKNQLTVIPQAFRRLETMHIMAKGFSQEALDCELRCQLLNALLTIGRFAVLDRRIPSAPLDADNLDEYTGEALTLPCAPHYNIPRHVGGQVSNIERVCRWVVEYPLTTSQRILHLTMPQTDDWSFSPEKHARDIDMDKDIFRYTTFSAAAAPLPPRGCAIPSVTVVIQPPWILSPQDLVAFVACGALPPYNPNGPVKDYTCSQRLWSKKIWDVCFRERSRWFVVTSYSGWVFGAFSKGWTRAFVSPIFKSDDQDPTVEEILVFWLASAVGVDGGWTIPEVSDEPEYVGVEIPCLVRDILPPVSFAEERRALMALSLLS
ncbi:hypothetical protein BKA93DRAFT_743354 [Sparassis latifolia]